MRDVLRAHPRARRPSSTTRACGCASSGAARASIPALRRADGAGPRRRPPPTTASRCSSRSTTAAGRRSSTPRARFSGGDRGGVPRAPLRARDARSGPDHPHERRAAALQLPAVAVGVLRAASSATSCGPTSRARPSRRRWRSTRRAGAASAGADGLRARRRAPTRRAPSARAAHEGSDLGARVARRDPGDRASRSFIVARGRLDLRRRRRRARPDLPARAVPHVRARAAGAGSRASSALVGLSSRPQLGDERQVLLVVRRFVPADVPARAGHAARGGTTRSRDGDHPARRVVDRAGARPRDPAARPAARRRRSSSTCWSGRSSATPAPTSAGAAFGTRPLAPRDLAQQDGRGPA